MLLAGKLESILLLAEDIKQYSFSAIQRCAVVVGICPAILPECDRQWTATLTQEVFSGR